MSESLEVQIARHDEQIKAIITTIDGGFKRLEDAFRMHALEDAEAHKRADRLARDVEIHNKVNKKVWGAIVLVASTVGSLAPAVAEGVVKLLSH